MENYSTGAVQSGAQGKPRAQNLRDLIVGLDDIQKSLDGLCGRARVSADRIDGGKPREAAGGEKPQAPVGGPLAYDLNRRANDMRSSLQLLDAEMSRLESGLGFNPD